VLLTSIHFPQSFRRTDSFFIAFSKSCQQKKSSHMPHDVGEVDDQPLLSSLIEPNVRNMIDQEDRTKDDTSIVTIEVARNENYHTTLQSMKRDAFDIDMEQCLSAHLDSGSTSTSESFIETDIEECIQCSRSIDREYDRNLLQLSTELLNPMNCTPLYPKDCILKKSALSIRWASPLAEIKELNVLKAEAFGSLPVTDQRSVSYSCSEGKSLSVTFVPAVADTKFFTSDICKAQVTPTMEPLPFRRTAEGNNTPIFFVPSCDSGDDLSIDCDSPIAASHSEIDPCSYWKSKSHRRRADERVHVPIAVYRHLQVGLLSVLVLIAALFPYSNAFLTRCSVSAHLINFIYSMMDVETRIALQRNYNRRDVRYRRTQPTFLDAKQNAIGVWLS